MYVVLVLENLTNLAYYKDVVFGAMLVIEFLGVWNNFEVQYKGVNSNQDVLKQWIVSMLTICCVLEASTLLFNYRSAFYTKAHQFR